MWSQTVASLWIHCSGCNDEKQKEILFFHQFNVTDSPFCQIGSMEPKVDFLHENIEFSFLYPLHMNFFLNRYILIMTIASTRNRRKHIVLTISYVPSSPSWFFSPTDPQATFHSLYTVTVLYALRNHCLLDTWSVLPKPLFMEQHWQRQVFYVWLCPKGAGWRPVGQCF